MKYKSKIDLFIHLCFVLMLVCMVWMLADGIMNSNRESIFSGIILLITNAALIIPIWFYTYYLLSEKALIIRCGIILYYTIPYENIISVEEKGTLISSPAMSLDRIRINYKKKNRNKKVYISPKYKTEFINELNKLIQKEENK